MAIWQKVFSRRNWQNRPSTATPLNETNLNVGDAALDTIDDRVIELNNRTNELEGYETAAAQSAAEAASSAEDSEAWAVGQRDGTDVPSSDDTYHNNSKYYSGMAQSYAVGTNGTVRPGDATDNAKYYYEQAQTVVADSLHDRGTTLFANLPTTNLIVGDIYKITDSFTTDSRFQIGAGVVIPANVSFYYGTNEKWNSFGGTGGGGHEIQNNSGTTMTQRDALQFKGLDVTDDSTNGRTVVEYKKEKITYQTWEGYSDAQKQAYRGLISNYPGLGLTSAETCMRASGTETVEQSLVSVASDLSELNTINISDKFTVDTTKADYFNAIKTGNVIHIDLSTNTITSGAWTILATTDISTLIPSKAVTSTILTQSANGYALLQIGNNGQVRLYSGTAAKFSGSLTYVVG